ncbi:hypothetical protein AN958_12010 [Leucoagaricus sp. SymC.cos]|nr:hypothetical protein AN958_12010 [Leucoagaricus sp. SymC.cos]
MNHLQSRLTTLSEHQLRSMVLRLAAQDPYFCDVFAMELEEASDMCFSDVESVSPLTPILPQEEVKQTSCCRTTRPRTLSNTRVHFPPPREDTSDSDTDQEDYTYHPGRLEAEEYEFLTVTQEGHTHRQVQTVLMWSCCEGDDTSPGCKSAPAHTVWSGQLRSRRHHIHHKSEKQALSRTWRA